MYMNNNETKEDKMNTENTTAMDNATSLEMLLEEMKNYQAPENSNGDEWCNLPTFGGIEPNDTQEVWSWDEKRLIVGTCRDDIEIINREDW